jgi:ABC-type branched-subunit amino acid transport system substrate-binding protein
MAVAVVSAVLVVAGAALATPSASVFRVAIIVPSSGDFSAQNQLIANGALVAASESGSANSAVGPIRLDLVTRTFTNTAGAGKLMASIAGSGINVVVLPCNIDATTALARAGAVNKLLMLSPCTPDPAATASVPMVWPTAMTGNAEAAQIVNLAVSLNGTSGFVLDAPGSSYVNVLSRYFREAMALDHVALAGQASVSLDGSNVDQVAMAIKASRARAIFTAVYSPYIERIISRLRALGVVQPFFVADGMDADQQLATYAKVLQGTTYAVFGFPFPTISDEFVRDYVLAFHKPADGSLPGLGYETLRILEVAAKNAGGTSPGALNSAFERGFNVSGVALESVAYSGHGIRQPAADVGMMRVAWGQDATLFATNPFMTLHVPAA